MPNDTRIVYRRNLLNKLLDNVWEYPLTLVEAPMGYGKTIAVKSFLQNSGVMVLWQTIFDSSPIIFGNSFSRLFRALNLSYTSSLIALGVATDHVLKEEAVEVIGGMKIPDRTVIVFDDYHMLTSNEIDQFIERLVKAKIPSLHIVVISRNAFGENTVELT